MTTKATTKREAALFLLRQGLVTQSEAAALAGASRQLVWHWVNVAELDAVEARQRYLTRLWSKAIQRARAG
jgi:hypothetical protein